MRFYHQSHRFYCGADLHARSMYLCILDHAGQTLLHRDHPADPRAFLDAVAPYRDNLVVAVECMFAWYWLADLCAEHGIPFVLGHALYMTAIHQGKSKDGEKMLGKAGIARWTRRTRWTTPGPGSWTPNWGARGRTRTRAATLWDDR